MLHSTSRNLYRHFSPSTLLSYLRPHLPYTITLLCLLENAHHRPSTIYLANFPENNLHDDQHHEPPFLFLSALDLSNDAPAQQVDFWSTYELYPRNTHARTEAELYLHQLLQYINKKLPDDYEQNIGLLETKNCALFLSMNNLYSPFFERLNFVDWKTHDYGKVREYVLWFDVESQARALGSSFPTVDYQQSLSSSSSSCSSSSTSDYYEDYGVPLLPQAENGEYSWTTITKPEEIDTVCSHIIFPRSPYLLQSCYNVAIHYTPHNKPGDRELVAWKFENLDGSGISLYIKEEHRLAGLGLLLSYELIRRAAVRRGSSKGIWWHFAVKEGNVGSERICKALGAKRMGSNVDFGVDVAKIREFAVTAGGRRRRNSVDITRRYPAEIARL